MLRSVAGRRKQHSPGIARRLPLGSLTVPGAHRWRLGRSASPSPGARLGGQVTGRLSANRMIAASDAVSVIGLAEIPDSLYPSGMSCCFGALIELDLTAEEPRPGAPRRRERLAGRRAGDQVHEVLRGHDQHQPRDHAERQRERERERDHEIQVPESDRNPRQVAQTVP